MAVLTFDYGTRHIGVAAVVSESHIAIPIATLKAKRGRPDRESLAQLIQEWSPSEFVVGLPLNLDETDSPMCDAVRKFGSYISHEFNVPVVYVDERLSTREADQRAASLEELTSSSSKRRNSIKRRPKTKKNGLGSHALAAQIIAETWLSQREERNQGTTSSESPINQVNS